MQATAVHSTNRALALAFGLLATVFLVCNGFFHHDAIFRHLLAGRHFVIEGTNLVVETERPRLVAMLPLSRLLVFLATFSAFVWCARAFYRGDARARIVGFFALLGWFAPQTRYLAIYLHDFVGVSWEQAWAMSASAVLTPATTLAVPAVARSFESGERALPWAKLPWGRVRLVALGIVIPWLFYVSDAYVAMWRPHGSMIQLVLAGTAALFCAISFVGLVRLKTWALVGSVVAAGLTTLWVFLSYRQGTVLFTSAQVAGVIALAPIVIVGGLAWPFLKVIVGALVAARAPGE